MAAKPKAVTAPKKPKTIIIPDLIKASWKEYFGEELDESTILEKRQGGWLLCLIRKVGDDEEFPFEAVQFQWHPKDEAKDKPGYWEVTEDGIPFESLTAFRTAKDIVETVYHNVD